MIKVGMTFRSWLLNTTIMTPPRALARISFSKETLRLIDEELREYRKNLGG